MSRYVAAWLPLNPFGMRSSPIVCICIFFDITITCEVAASARRFSEL